MEKFHRAHPELEVVMISKGEPKENRAKEPVSAAAIFEKASPSIVLVRTNDRRLRSIGFGSGFVVSADGLIATKYHVIQGAASAGVVFGDNAGFPVEGVVAVDEESDLAVLTDLCAANGINVPQAAGHKSASRTKELSR